jgi:5-methylcytosine-specific restriction endonuclease McrA
VTNYKGVDVAKRNLFLFPCGTNAAYDFHLKNKEKPCDSCRIAHNEYAKKWRDSHKQQVAQANKKSRLAHPDRVKRNKKSWNDQNPDKAKAFVQNSRKKNPLKYAELGAKKSRKRRAIKVNNGFEPYSTQEVLEIYGFDCHICAKPINLEATRKCGNPGWEFGLHIDHLIPIIKGGADALNNVRPAHAICNLKKGSTLKQ